MNRAAVDRHSFRRRACGEVAVLPSGAPPVQAVVLHAQTEVKQHPHERHSGVQRRGEDVVVSHPPLLPVPVNEEVEDGSDGDPGVVVDRGGRRHHRRSSEEDGKVYERDP